MEKLLLFSFFLITTFGNQSFAQQNKKLDSLNNLLKTAKHDTTRFNAYSEIASIFQNTNPDTAIYILNKARLIAGKIPGDDGRLREGETIRATGWDYYLKSDYTKALENYEKSLSIAQKCVANKNTKLQAKAKKLQAASLGNIGIVYDVQGDYSKTLSYFFEALKINEESGNKKAQASTLGNIGIVYQKQNDYPKALDYHFKALKINEELGNKKGLAATFGNIGAVYYLQNDYSKTLDYYFKALKIHEETDNKKGQSITLGNIGNVYDGQGDYSNALSYLLKALKIKEEIGDKSGQAMSLGNIGALYTKLKKYTLAEKYLKQAEQLNRDLGVFYNLKDVSSYLSELYFQTGRHKEALHYYKEHILYRDSVNSEENQKAAIQKEMQFNYDKKAAADSVKAVEERKVIDAQMKQEKTQRFALYGGLALVIVFAVFMYNRFRVTNKQKQIIEIKEKETQQQKHIIEEKHKEITDSINYAERIQRSFLATKELLDENLNDYFVLFQPKDVVSGDFYWATKLSNGNFALATADSTGHGVPGAIMSLLNITSLESAIKDGYTQPSEILNATRKTIIERLKKDGSAEGGKDGMDCSLTVYDFNRSKLFVTAANNPVWIVRGTEVIEIKPDKMPVGKHDKQDVLFTQHEIDLQNGDVVYTLTDGFPDQFGGESGKKFMSKKLRELLLANANLAMHEQKQLLQTTFKNWVGDLEQVDDVCVIGVRV
ncbi:MAG: tetratricopeptide repeat protein [Bacteroidota bacterium]